MPSRPPNRSSSASGGMCWLRSRESRGSRLNGKLHITLQSPSLIPAVRLNRLVLRRDSEESAPAEYPPEQPEADTVDDDGATYGAEEEEVLEDEETTAHEPSAAMNGEQEHGDQEMAGAEDTAGAHAPGTVADHAESKDGDEASDAGSEDLEAESSGSDDEELDEEEGDVEGEVEGEGEGDGDEDMEMGDDGEQKAGAVKDHPLGQARNGEVMVH